MSDLADAKLPLVSIGVPTFNRPAELKRAVTAQADLSNIEIIVLDNCSTLPGGGWLRNLPSSIQG